MTKLTWIIEFLNYDIDNDGTDEIILNSGYHSQYHLRILKYKYNEYISIWTSKNYKENIVKLFTVKDVDQDSVDELIVVLGDGTLELYDLTSLKIKASHSITATYPSAFDIADINNDGVQEYLFVSNGYFKVINTITYEEEFSSDVLNAKDIKVGDVDNDGKDDIILSSGKVLDALTYQVKWEYSEGFGNKIALSDVDNDSVKEIISIGNFYYITAYDAQLKTLLWQINTDSDTEGLFVTDYDDDNSPEIIVGNNQWGDITCYKSSDRKVLWNIRNPLNGTTNILSADVDNDGTKEVIWGAGHTTSGEDKMFIADPIAKKIEWESLDLDSPFFVSASNIDNDNIMEFVAASSKSNSGYDDGVLLVFDSEDCKTEYAATTDEWAELTSLTTVNLDDQNSEEIIYTLRSKICIVDGKTHSIISQYTLPLYYSVTAIKVDDIDNDGVKEIIVGDEQGYITIVDSKNLTQEWRSIKTGGAIDEIVINNYDSDASKEIVFFSMLGSIQVYDGTSHLLEWKSNNIEYISAIDIADIDLDGTKEFIVGKITGGIEIFNSKTYEKEAEHQLSNEAINAITVANLDSSYGYEVITGTTRIAVFSAKDFKKKWESEYLCENIGTWNNLFVKDINQNGNNDIIAAGRWGFFQYEVNSKYPDFTPPFVKLHKPSSGQKDVSLNTQIEILFSEAIDSSGISNNVFIQNGNHENITYSYSYSDSLGLKLQPQILFLTQDTIKIILTNNIKDIAGNPLDGNLNGISEADSIDNYTFSFITESGIDTISPVFVNITCPDTIWRGTDIELKITAADSSAASTGSLKYAEYFIDSLGVNGTGIPLPADDGEINSIEEHFTFTLNTDEWNSGEHSVFLIAQDMKGNWSKPEKINIYVIYENPANWVTNGYNNQHTGFNEGDSIALPLSLLLRKEYTYYKLSPITVINDKMIFAGNDLNSNKLFCCRTDNGETLWSKEFSNYSNISQASFAQGNIYVQVTHVSSTNYLYCFNLDTGEEIWKAPFSSQSNEYYAPAVSNGKVFANCGLNGGLYSFNAAGGEQLWTASLPQFDKWSPAVYNNVVYTYVENKLSAFDQNTGTLLWDKLVAYDLFAFSMNTSPVIDIVSNTIFVTSWHYLHAIDINTHEVKWMKKGVFSVTPAILNNQLYVLNDNRLIVHDVEKGDTLWSFKTTYGFIHPPVISNGLVFVSTFDEIFGLRIKDKKSIWKYPTGGRLSIANNKLFIASDSGYVLIFGKGITGIDNNENLPESYGLRQNYPNPFNPSTTIEYHLPEASGIKIQIYNMMGELIETLADQYQSAGYHKIVWKANDYSSGVYFCRIFAESEKSKFTETKKMVYLK